MGHSNGGQGAWYLASRFPDRVLGGKTVVFLVAVPDSFISSDDSCTGGGVYQVASLYTFNNVTVGSSLATSAVPDSRVAVRSAHFIDPALRAILETSLTPDNNDLFMSNIADIPVLAVHGYEYLAHDSGLSLPMVPEEMTRMSQYGIHENMRACSKLGERMRT